jgi:hypothetical protein
MNTGIGCYGLVAMDWLLWIGCYGLVSGFCYFQAWAAGVIVIVK